MPAGRKVKAVIPGGSSAPVLRRGRARRGAGVRGAQGQADTMAGSGGVIVMDDSTCMVRCALARGPLLRRGVLRPVHAVPRGHAVADALLRKIEEGRGEPGDLEMLLNVAASIAPYPPIGLGNTICALGDAAALPVHSFVSKFRAEFEAHIARAALPLRRPALGRTSETGAVAVTVEADPLLGLRASARVVVGGGWWSSRAEPDQRGDVRWWPRSSSSPASTCCCGRTPSPSCRCWSTPAPSWCSSSSSSCCSSLSDDGPRAARSPSRASSAAPRRVGPARGAGRWPSPAARRAPMALRRRQRGDLRHARSDGRSCSTPQYLLPFEAVSLLLLVAIVGAVVVAKSRI